LGVSSAHPVRWLSGWPLWLSSGLRRCTFRRDGTRVDPMVAFAVRIIRAVRLSSRLLLTPILTDFGKLTFSAAHFLGHCFG